MPTGRKVADTPTAPPTQAEAPLQSVLDAFRVAASGSVTEALRAARDDERVRHGELPAFGIDGLEVDLNVGVEWQGDGQIRLRFDTELSAASRIRFKVQPLPIEAVLRPRIEITELYDPAGIEGLHQYIVRIMDEKNGPIGNAPLTLRLVRADRPHGQTKYVRFQADHTGTATFDINTARRLIRVGRDPEEGLPAKAAVAWRLDVECLEPPITSDPIVVSRRRRTESGR